MYVKYMWGVCVCMQACVCAYVLRSECLATHMNARGKYEGAGSCLSGD